MQPQGVDAVGVFVPDRDDRRLLRRGRFQPRTRGGGGGGFVLPLLLLRRRRVHHLEDWPRPHRARTEAEGQGRRQGHEEGPELPAIRVRLQGKVREYSRTGRPIEVVDGVPVGVSGYLLHDLRTMHFCHRSEIARGGNSIGFLGLRWIRYGRCHP